MGSLYLLRHGQASFGAHDYDALSAIGEQQASVLGQALAQSKLRVDRVLCGTMKRHIATARLCLEAMDKPPVPEAAPWLNEFDHEAILRALRPDLAEPDGLRQFMEQTPEPARAFHKEYEKAMIRWMQGQHESEYPESYEQFKQRCRMGVSDLLGSCRPDANILLFTSGGPIASLLQLTLELSDAIMLRCNAAIVNASITRLSFKGDQLFLSSFNDHAHFGKVASPLLTHR